MGIKLIDLLRWSKEIELKKDDGTPVLDKHGESVKVWLRVIGDQDLEDSYRAARAASARRRATLRDKNSDDYLATLSIIEEANQEACTEIIVAAQRRDFNQQAFVNVVRPELPKLNEVAEDADAPTLEEQEKFDQLTEKLNTEYLTALDAYVDDREVALRSELLTKPIDELRDMTAKALADVQSLETFISELNIQKTYRATYSDRLFKEPAFENLHEFRQFKLREQLMNEYGVLELAPDDVKN